MKFETYCKKLIAKLQIELHLQHYELIIAFEKTECRRDSNTFADCLVEDKYHRAKITIYKPLEEQFRDGNLRRVHLILIHELVHVIIGGLHNYASESVAPNREGWYECLLEQTTEHLTRLLHRLIPKSRLEV